MKDFLRDHKWELFAVFLTGAPLVFVYVITQIPSEDIGNLFRGLFECFLLGLAGWLSGTFINRLSKRRWIKIIVIVFIPFATFFWMYLDYEAARIEMEQGIANSKGKYLRKIEYENAPLLNAISWFFINIPFARVLAYFAIPLLAACCICFLNLFCRRANE